MFDRQAVNKVHRMMELTGTKFAMGTSPTAIVKGDDGKLTVTLAASKSTTTEVCSLASRSNLICLLSGARRTA